MHLVVESYELPIWKLIVKTPNREHSIPTRVDNRKQMMPMQLRDIIVLHFNYEININFEVQLYMANNSIRLIFGIFGEWEWL